MDRQPNLLFIMTDQQRWDALGCESRHHATPNLDRLAAEGVRFTTCFTNSPVCVPTRLSLATGLYPHTTGVWDNQPHDLSPRCPTWMAALREAGYRTSLFGKTHLHRHHGDLRDREHLMHAYGLDDIDEIGGPRASCRCRSHMTDRWESKGLWQAYQDDYAERFGNVPHVARPSPLPEEEYADVYVGERAREYLAGYDRDQPWFCWVSFGGPHEPWDAPASWAERHAPEDQPPAQPRPDWMTADEGTSLAGHCRKRPEGFSPEDVAAMRANYAANVELIDHQVGRLLETVEARGELANTMVVFTSDHGEHNGDHGLIYKSTFLDAAARIPLIVRHADGRAAGQVAQTPCELIDAGATLLELAGVEPDYRQFGRSLAPCLDDPATRVREYALCEHRGEIMVADEAWKLMLRADGEPYALIDRESDPGEQRNLLADPAQADRIATMRVALQRLLQQHQLREPRECRAREEDVVVATPASA